MNIMFVQPFEEYDVLFGIANPGDKNRKTLIITTRVPMTDKTWEGAEYGRIIFAGGVVPELKRLLEKNGRRRINNATKCDQYPKGVLYSGSSYDSIRYHLGLSDYVSNTSRVQ